MFIQMKDPEEAKTHKPKFTIINVPRFHAVPELDGTSSEAFILLHSRGYKAQAEHLYQRLLNELQALPTKLLVDDFQRTLTLVEPARQQPENLIWAYHWTVSNEMEKRSAGALQKALKLAGEEP